MDAMVHAGAAMTGGDPGVSGILAQQSDCVDDPVLLAATSLRDLDFEDLYVGRDFGTFCNIETHLHENTPPLVGVPPNLTSCVSRLSEAVFAAGDRTERTGFFFEFEGIRFRVQRMNTIEGVWYDCRWVKHPPRLGSLVGLHPMVRRVLQVYGSGGAGNFNVRPGLLLITGETASGKTTFGLSLVEELLTLYGRVAVSAEDPVEVVMQGRYGDGGRGYFYQHDVSAMGGYGATLEAAMRMRPRIIYVGEIRRPEEARKVIEASLNGHIVIATMHSDSIINAINRLSFMTGERDIALYNMASGLIGVTHQTLTKRKGQRGKEIVMSSLFFDDSQGPRAMVREGAVHQLATTIESQAAKMSHGFLPVFEKH